MTGGGAQDRALIAWLRRVGRAASTATRLISVVGVLVSIVLRITGSDVVPRYAAVVVFVAALAYAGRLLVHAADRYCKRGPLSAAERRIRTLYLWSVALLVVWFATALAFMRWHSAVLELLCVLALWALTTWNACLIIDALPAAVRRRGTEALRDFAWFKKLRRVAEHSGLLSSVLDRLDNVTPESNTSSYFDRLSIVLLLVVVLLAPFSAVEAAERLMHWTSLPHHAAAPIAGGRTGAGAHPARDEEATGHTDASPAGYEGAGGKAGDSTSTGSGELPRGEKSEPARAGAEKPQAGEDAEASGSTPGASARSEAEPTFAEQCPGALRSLTGGTEDPLTHEVAESMLRLWEEEGATAAGCPGRAERVEGQRGVWYAVGSCGAARRTLAVYVPGQGSTMQYQQAAQFGLELAKEGELMNASSRGEVAGGDFYLFQTPAGTYALSRSTSATGGFTARATKLWCERFTSTNVKYVVTEPEATRTWRAVDEAFGFTWPERERSVGKARAYAFVLATGDRRDVAGAICQSAEACTPWSMEGELPALSSAPVTLGEMRFLAKHGGSSG